MRFTPILRLAALVADFALASVAACGRSTYGAAEGGRASDSAGGAVLPASTALAARGSAAAPRAANHEGRIPVLEYHVIGGTQNAAYTRTVASFEADLQDVYARGYRPITIAQLLDKNFDDVPAGMSPVVFVFDDASPEQFSYVEEPGGGLAIDSTSAIGIWEDFAKTHPGWMNRATFCVLSGAQAGHNLFGDNPKFHGQRAAWRFRKLQWLAEQGFELCDHTVWHMELNKYPDAQVQQQIAANMMAIDSAVPGYQVRTLALPYGLWPKNRELAWQGTWTDPKTGLEHPYHFDAVLEVAGGPARSPFDPQFNPHSITRIQAVNDEIRHALDQLDRSNARFVK